MCISFYSFFSSRTAAKTKYIKGEVAQLEQADHGRKKISQVERGKHQAEEKAGSPFMCLSSKFFDDAFL